MRSGSSGVPSLPWDSKDEGGDCNDHAALAAVEAAVAPGRAVCRADACEVGGDGGGGGGGIGAGRAAAVDGAKALK